MGSLEISNIFDRLLERVDVQTFLFWISMSYPSICKHNVFRKEILVIYLIYDKPPKDANGYGFPDGERPAETGRWVAGILGG